MPAHAAPVEHAGRSRAQRGLALIDSHLTRGVGLTILLAAALCAAAFGAGGGLQLASATTVEIWLTLGGGLLVAGAVLTDTRQIRLAGGGALLGMLALAVITIASLTWSLAPSDSWLEGSRTIAYTSIFAAALYAARVAANRWPSVIFAVALSAAAICAYALLTKIFPASLNPSELYARLREPYGYWNAIGLTAAIGVPPCLWLGARREGHGAINALAYPAAGTLLLTIFLAYSRGALLALAIGCAFWFATVPLRLRGAAVLICSGSVVAVVIAWVFGHGALTHDRVDLALRTQAGHQFGLLVAVMVVTLMAVGLAVGFLSARAARSTRRRDQAGLALIVCLALVPVAVAGAATVSSRGLGGTISHSWNALTDPHARTPANDPSRLTAVGSVRARYWNDALKIFQAHPVIGVGAGGYGTARLRYRSDTLDVLHAHGYLVQTLADLGLLGLLVSLGTLGAWVVAATRSARPWDWHPRLPPERVGLLTLVSCTIVFGVHSFVDWTWFIPGNAVVGLLCAGWVAGRGPLGHTGTRIPRAARTLRTRQLMAGAVVVVTLIACWTELQPLRAAGQSDRALAALDHHDLAGARAAARRASRIDPVSVAPLFDLAVIQTSSGDPRGARRTLEQAVARQPGNPQTWLRLADFDLAVRNSPRGALRDLRPAVYLDPHGFQVLTEFLAVIRRLGGTPTTSTAPGQPVPTARIPTVTATH